MAFCTAITCMDGRIQLPVNQFLQKYFNAPFVDTVTEPGINRVLSERNNLTAVRSIMKRTDISVNAHASQGIAVVGHHDCAGNTVDKEKQLEHIQNAVQFLKQSYQNIEIIGLWVDDKWNVNLVK